jgi:antitoxin component HigA of HigAB toxin-antitoxin module
MALALVWFSHLHPPTATALRAQLRAKVAGMVLPSNLAESGGSNRVQEMLAGRQALTVVTLRRLLVQLGIA